MFSDYYINVFIMKIVVRVSQVLGYSKRRFVFGQPSKRIFKPKKLVSKDLIDNYYCLIKRLTIHIYDWCGQDPRDDSLSDCANQSNFIYSIYIQISRLLYLVLSLHKDILYSVVVPINDEAIKITHAPKRTHTHEKLNVTITSSKGYVSNKKTHCLKHPFGGLSPVSISFFRRGVIANVVQNHLLQIHFIAYTKELIQQDLFQKPTFAFQSVSISRNDTKKRKHVNANIKRKLFRCVAFPYEVTFTNKQKDQKFEM